MIRTMCKALTVAVGLAVLASVAMAGIPDASQSTTDGDLMVANARGFAVLALTNVKPTVTDGYQVTVRDVGGTPLAGVTVTMNLAGSGLQAHATQSAGQTANCAANVVAKGTDGAGAVTLQPAAVGLNTSAGPNVQVRANGVLLTTIRMPSVDLSTQGTNGVVGGFDFNEFRLRFLNLPGYSNTDPAADFATLLGSGGAVDGFDFNVFRTEFLCGAGGAPAPCSQTACP